MRSSLLHRKRGPIKSIAAIAVVGAIAAGAAAAMPNDGPNTVARVVAAGQDVAAAELPADNFAGMNEFLAADRAAQAPFSAQRAADAAAEQAAAEQAAAEQAAAEQAAAEQAAAEQAAAEQAAAEQAAAEQAAAEQAAAEQAAAEQAAAEQAAAEQAAAEQAAAEQAAAEQAAAEQAAAEQAAAEEAAAEQAAAEEAAAEQAAAPEASTGSHWDRLADCESGNWDGDGNPISGSARWDYGISFSHGDIFEGGVNFHPGTWDSYRSGDMAGHAGNASRSQQIAVAEQVLADQGWGAWPVCSRKVGLR